MIFKEFRGEFSRNWSSLCPDILQKLHRYSYKIVWWIFQESNQLMPRKLKFRKKYWMIFPEIRLCQTLENVTFGKNLDEFSDALEYEFHFNKHCWPNFITWPKLTNQHQSTSSPLVEFNGYKRLKFSYDESNPI